jgi:hypothetical protein
MSPDNLALFVRSSALLQRIPLDDARVGRVAQHLGRTAAIAGLLEAVSLSPEEELTELFCPAVYPLTSPL